MHFAERPPTGYRLVLRVVGRSTGRGAGHHATVDVTAGPPVAVVVTAEAATVVVAGRSHGVHRK